MRHSFLFLVSTVVLSTVAALSAQTPKAAHPDLSGIWAYSIDLPPVAIKKEVKGAVTIQKVNLGATVAQTPLRGALPSTPAPSYKPELQAKVNTCSTTRARRTRYSTAVSRASRVSGRHAKSYKRQGSHLLLRRHLGRPVPNYSRRRKAASGRRRSDVLRRFGRALGRQHPCGRCE